MKRLVQEDAPEVHANSSTALPWWRWRPTEIIILGYFTWLLALCCDLGSARPLRPWMVPDAAVLLAVVALHVIPLQTRWQHGREITRHVLGIFVILPLAYKQAGAFGTRLFPSSEHWLIATDRMLFHIDWTTRQPAAASPWTALLQGAYLGNYLLLVMALSLGIVLLPRDRYGIAHGFPRARWIMLESVCGSLLGGLFLAYALYPLLPAITPRLYFAQLRHPSPALVHDINWWLLARFSIPWGIFPSGHVAGPSAVACALAARRRRGWALFFAIGALLIGTATVVGDYHFVSDAMAGTLAGTAGWGLVEIILRRQHSLAAESLPDAEVEAEPVPGADASVDSMSNRSRMNS